MAFVERWKAINLFEVVDLIVMEDNPQKTFPMPNDISCVHLCWEDIEESLGVHSWIIPRRSDTVRSYAYNYAWRKGYKYILTLDDDCYPPTEEDGLRYDGPGFVKNHLTWLQGRTRWMNTLNSVKPRGIPFYNVGQLGNVVVNHGLWTNVLDYDAPYQLANPIKEEFSFDNKVVPTGMYFPMCGMNVMWKRDVTVLMYHLLMGQRICAQPDAFTVKDGVKQPILERLPFDRFGDIWCGIIMKKIADRNNLLVSSGMPYIRHERASNPFTNLKKEANGIEVNERLWERVDSTPLAGGNLVEDYKAVGVHIGDWQEFPEYREYWQTLGEAMVKWAELFRERP